MRDEGELGSIAGVFLRVRERGSHKCLLVSSPCPTSTNVRLRRGGGYAADVCLCPGGLFSKLSKNVHKWRGKAVFVVFFPSQLFKSQFAISAIFFGIVSQLSATFGNNIKFGHLW